MDNVIHVLMLLAAIASGIATAIPLAVKLVEAVKALVKERNWSKLVDETIEYMAIAKDKFDDNTNKKEWVMSMVKHSAETLKYEIDMDAISSLIDSICDVSKILRDQKA